MKIKKICLVLNVVCGLCFAVFPAYAQLGLAQIAASPEGTPGVGRAVLAAAQAVYANNTDPVVIQGLLADILNEAAALGNERAIRYAVVAVMAAGGASNIELSRAAINGSNLFSSYPDLVAETVAAVQELITASGGAGAGGGAAGGGTGGGIGDQTLGGGSPIPGTTSIDWTNPFTWEGLIGPGDDDAPATRV